MKVHGTRKSCNLAIKSTFCVIGLLEHSWLSSTHNPFEKNGTAYSSLAMVDILNDFTHETSLSQIECQREFREEKGAGESNIKLIGKYLHRMSEDVLAEDQGRLEGHLEHEGQNYLSLLIIFNMNSILFWQHALSEGGSYE